MADFTRSEVDGVLTVTLTREAKRNAVNLEIWDAIEGAVYELAERDDLRVLVLTAEGTYFTAGMDITTLIPNPGLGEDGVLRGSNTRLVYRDLAHHDAFDFMEIVEKPIILAPQAHCVGVGVEMGVSCDFRLASENATFSLAEIPNLNVLPASGGISRLTRLIGPHWARWIAMAGQVVDAEQALAIGLVHAVYPAAEFQQKVQGSATHLAGLPREPLGLAKMAIDIAADVDCRTARDFDRLSQTLLFHSKEWQDSLAAFNNRSATRPASE